MLGQPRLHTALVAAGSLALLSLKLFKRNHKVGQVSYEANGFDTPQDSPARLGWGGGVSPKIGFLIKKM